LRLRGVTLRVCSTSMQLKSGGTLKVYMSQNKFIFFYISSGFFRYENGLLVCPKKVTSSPIAAYENTVEVESLDQLEDIISDPDEMRMQALLVTHS
jgi:hypothetical protein